MKVYLNSDEWCPVYYIEAEDADPYKPDLECKWLNIAIDLPDEEVYAILKQVEDFRRLQVRLEALVS